MNSKGKIHLGDLMRALHRLGWSDADQVEAIGSFLGFDLDQMPQTRHHADSVDPRLRQEAQKSPRTKTPPKKPVFPKPPEMPPDLPSLRSSSNLKRLSTNANTAPENDEWKDASDTIFNRPSQPRLPRQNLFMRNKSRHIFTAALGTQRKSHEIDMPALIDQICTNRVVLDIPQTLETTLESGCHLLRDFSHTMTLWWDDLLVLSEQINQIISDSKNLCYRFDSIPEKPMRWVTGSKRENWQADGRPVLVATDFGVQGTNPAPPLDKSWHDLIDQCQQTASPLLFLIPWSKSMWPNDTGNYPQLIHWSPNTSVAIIKKAIADSRYAGW
jgi:hypothetical protein